MKKKTKSARNTRKPARKTASRKTAPRKTARPAGKRVACRRVENPRRVDEHLRCPYCYGKVEDVAEGKHKHFCDYEPGKDPIVYGFPEKSSRIHQG